MTTNRESQAKMKSKLNTTKSGKLAVAARIVLGLVFGLSGTNHLFQLMPMPPMTGDSALFWQGLEQTGYFFPLLGMVELGAGALLATGWLVPLALALVAPIIVNIAFFHAVLAPGGLGITAVVMASALVVLQSQRMAFARVLAARADVRSVSVRAVEVLLGVTFLASGVAGALGHTPPPATAGAALMMNGLEASGYFVPLLTAVQIAAGGLLVTRRYVGLALLALAPVVVEIAAYRLYVASATPGMLVVAAAIVAATAGLAVAHRRMFAPWAAGGGDGADGGAPRTPAERMTPASLVSR
jgi:hypothetical protein